MGTVESIIELCNEFKRGEYDLEEYQSRLRTIVIEDKNKRKIERILRDVDNKLEEIRFCYLEANYYSYGIDVADYLMESVKDMK